MNSYTNAGLNQNSKPVPNDRPNSSRFPPLVRQSPEQHFMRSSSFDYSFSDSKLEFKKNENKSSNSPTNDSKQNRNFVENRFKKESAGHSREMDRVLPRSTGIDECQRLRSENQVLKNNFLRMSRIIQKHSRLMAKKDDIILKLQEKNTINYLPVIEPDSQYISRQQNEPVSLSSHLIAQPIQTSEEIQSKNSEFSQKFRQIYDSMIGDFNQHLIQFMKVIEEMQKFLENNLKVIERRNSDIFENKSEIEAKLQALNTDFNELKNNYEVLIKQNKDFKSFIEFMVNSINTNSAKDLTSSESIASLRQHFTDLLSKNQSLSEEIVSTKKYRKSEEDYCFWLIECLSELELELELTGRSPKTLSKVIEKFDQKLESIRQTLSQTYLQSLNKTLIQIYRNHLKWFQFVNKPSKSTQTWIQSRAEDSSTEEEEMGSDDKQMVCFKTNHKLKSEEKERENNDISDEIKSKFDEMSDDMPFDDFDIESINYILMAKHFDYNLKSNLEVVEEVEEEDIEEEEQNDSELSYEDDVFEKVEECSDNCLKASKQIENDNYVQNDCKNQNIESQVKQVLNEILNQIDNEFSTKIEENCQGQSHVNNIVLNKKDVLYSPSTSSCSLAYFANENNNEWRAVDAKPQNIDSDFVSDDLSSSPETVMNHPDNLNKQILRNDQNHNFAFLTTFDELTKHMNSRQSPEDQSITSEDKNTDNNQKQQSKADRYLSDELRAWKELVEQQKAIMEKIRNELEEQQKMNSEKDKTIESLKSQSKCDSLAENSENQTSVHQNSDKFVDVSDDESKTLMDELELNNLFNDNSESDDNDLEVIEVSHCLNEGNDICDTSDKKSPDIVIQEVWPKADDLLDQNYVSDESSGYSVYTGNLSPLSAPELLPTARRKVFIPFSHEDAAVRRHSCQGRLIRYGNHPRKKKLELKNVDIVFHKEKIDKEVKKPKANIKNLPSTSKLVF